MSPPAPSTSRPFITRHTVIVILLAIALVLLVAGLVCAAVPRTIFGQGWDTWLISAWIAIVLARLIETVN
jgi:hypothetical protein